MFVKHEETEIALFFTEDISLCLNSRGKQIVTICCQTQQKYINF